MSVTHIIGGGLAGLAAALALTEAGRRVIIYEAGPACGGRARSYFDRELGCRIDNGNHLLLSGNRAAMRYLDIAGARDTLAGPAGPVFPFMDLRTGQRWTLRPNAGRVPWWVFSAGRGVPGARLADYAKLLRLRFAGAEDTVGGLLPHNALYERLIEPLAVSGLNTPAAAGSARLFWAIVAETLARGGAQCVPCWPKIGSVGELHRSGGGVDRGARRGAAHQPPDCRAADGRRAGNRLGRRWWPDRGPGV